jgi:outer membrane protein assembly factor BamE (lipoprotein component of BamABCDE complex)
MARFLRSLCLLALGLGLGCAHGPGREVTLPQLKAALDSPVDSAAQNSQNSQLAEHISNDKQLHGMTRSELAEQLGPGDVCSRHPLCAERGFDDNDWYYEVGQEGGSYLRHRPALIVGFNRFAKVERTFVLRVE